MFSDPAARSSPVGGEDYQELSSQITLPLLDKREQPRGIPEGTADSQSPIMSGISPYSSYNSVPFFSADDRTIISSDVGVGQDISAEREIGRVYASGQENVPLAFQNTRLADIPGVAIISDDGLYSFSDSSIKPHPLKPHPQEARTQVTSSFGVSHTSVPSSRSSSVVSDWRGQSQMSVAKETISDSKESTPVPSDVPASSLMEGGDSEQNERETIDYTDSRKHEHGGDSVEAADDRSDGSSSPTYQLSSAETPEHHSNSVPEPYHDFSLPLHSLSRIDSDIETSSVVSIQQLTETLLSDIPGSNHHGCVNPASTRTLSDEQNSQSGQPHTSIPLKLIPDALPSHLQPSPCPPATPPPIEPHFLFETAPPADYPASPVNPLKSPLHLQSSPYKPTTTLIYDDDSSQKPPIDHTTDDEKSLNKQLTYALQEKANLEGQLESVLEECKTALSGRAELQSKVARVEAEKAAMADMLEREKYQPLDTSLQENSYDFEELKGALKEAKQAVETEKNRVSDLKKDVSKEKVTLTQLQGELNDATKELAEKDAVISELQTCVKHHQIEQEKKDVELEEMRCKLSALEASYGTLEETKSWLHDQLQDSLKEKQTVQEEFREAKTTAMAQSIKTDQLTKENTSFQQQIAELQQGILHDKARLVSELEAIEADVLSREDSYSRLVTEKAQLEHVAKRKEEALEQMSSDLARSQVENEESQKKIEDLETQNIATCHKMDELIREKNHLADKLQSREKEMAAKDCELKQLEQLKNSLQEKCRQSDAALIGKEGTIQGLNDAKEILRHELAMVKQDRDSLDSVLNEAKKEMTKLETELMDAEHKLQDKFSQLQSAGQDRETLQSENQELTTVLAEKERELDEKTQQLQTLEDQSSDLIGQFKSLEGQFQNITSKRDNTDDEMAEKNRVITHLSAEKDKMENELISLRDHNQTLNRDLSKLEEERARLQGQVEVSTSTASEELLKIVQDKSQLQAEVNSLKMSHQQELAKTEAKLRKMENEMKSAKREASRAVRELQMLATEKKHELNKLEDALSKAHADTKEAKSRMELALREKDSIESMLNVPTQSEPEEVDRLRARCQQLTEENESLTEKIKMESSQKEELERAGIMVATKLKQNAKQEQRNLQNQIREMSLEVEKLKGRLTGMSSAKTAIREHVAKMEAELAKKESALVQLSAQVQKVLSEKELEDESLNAQITSLEKQLEESTKIAETASLTATAERRRGMEFGHELSVRDLEVAELTKTVERVRGHDLVSLKEQVSFLEEERRQAQKEVGELKSQLMAAKSAGDCASRELTDKEAQCSILRQEIEIARGKCQQAVEENQLLKERLDQLTTEMSQQRRPFETSLSTIEGDDTDGGDVSLSGIHEINVD